MYKGLRNAALFASGIVVGAFAVWAVKRMQDLDHLDMSDFDDEDYFDDYDSDVSENEPHDESYDEVFKTDKDLGDEKEDSDVFEE